MSSNNKRALLVLAVFCLALAVHAQTLLVGSYNIRYANKADEARGFVWNKRCQVICDQINFEEPDVFGAQEVLYGQLNDLLKGLPQYHYVGVGRDDGKQAGEYAAIFYRRDKFDKIDDGHFWLSQTPEKPALGWDAACIRICTWGKFKERNTGFTFYFFNLHTDHVGVTARRESVKLVLNRIKEIAGKDSPALLTGDFNVDQNDETYAIITQSRLLNDSYAVAQHRFIENGTFNNFDTNLKTDSRIDHIFVSKGFNVSRYAVLSNFYWTEDTTATTKKGTDAPQQINLKHSVLRTASDHYPVFAKVQWRNK